MQNTEQVEHSLDNFDPAQLQPGGALHFTAADVATDPNAVLAKVCGIYRGVLRPIMQVSKWIPFLGKKVRNTVADTEALLDQLCPES